MPRKTNENAAPQARTNATKAAPMRHKKATPIVAEAVDGSVAVKPVSGNVLSQTSLAPVETQPDRGEVARVAYFYWERRGYQGGSPQEDWLRAERELRDRNPLSAKAQASA